MGTDYFVVASLVASYTEFITAVSAGKGSLFVVYFVNFLLRFLIRLVV